jgi:molybdopterin synthase sulfur carrier subunit
VEGQGNSIHELIENLEKSYNGLRERICDETGSIRRFINVYVNEEDIRFLQGISTPLKAGDLVSIVPAIAGGH